MIVGLKRRSKSKKFYELAVVDKLITKEESKIQPRKSGDIKIYDYKTTKVLIKLFEPIIRGTFPYQYSTSWAYKDIKMVEKICNEDNPSSCKNEICPHRFRCLTTRIDIEDKTWGEYIKR